MAGCAGGDGVAGFHWQVGDLLYLNFEMPVGTSRRTWGCPAEHLEEPSASFNMGMLEVVYIIDLYPEAVAERVNLLLQEQSKIKIFGYIPDSLDNLVEYSLNQ